MSRSNFIKVYTNLIINVILLKKRISKVIKPFTINVAILYERYINIESFYLKAFISRGKALL